MNSLCQIRFCHSIVLHREQRTVRKYSLQSNRKSTKRIMEFKGSVTPTSVTVFYDSLHCLKTWKKLYLGESSADVKFVFVSDDGTQRYVPAHKLLLSHGSPVFEAMFSGKFKEANTVEIVDATCDEFKEFLQVFYLTQLTLTLQNIPSVMNLANKYDVPECFELCEKFFMESAPVDSICLAFDLALTFNRSQLKERCHYMISQYSAAVFASDSFRKCSQAVLKQILERGTLNCSARDLFNACMNWSEQACVRNGLDTSLENRKKQLGECFYLIPFHLMNAKEVNQCIMAYKDLFDRDECAELIRIMADGPFCLTKLEKFKPKTLFKTVESYKSDAFKFTNPSTAATSRHHLPFGSLGFGSSSSLFGDPSTTFGASSTSFGTPSTTFGAPSTVSGSSTGQHFHF